MKWIFFTIGAISLPFALHDTTCSTYLGDLGYLVFAINAVAFLFYSHLNEQKDGNK